MSDKDWTTKDIVGCDVLSLTELKTIEDGDSGSDKRLLIDSSVFLRQVSPSSRHDLRVAVTVRSFLPSVRSLPGQVSGQGGQVSGRGVLCEGSLWKDSLAA